MESNALFMSFLDNLVNVAARLAIIVAMLAIMVGVLQLVAFLWLEPEQTRTAKVLVILHSNWRALIIVAIPIFYPAIRRFIEEMDSIPGLGITRKKGNGKDLEEDIDSDMERV